MGFGAFLNAVRGKRFRNLRSRYSGGVRVRFRARFQLGAHQGGHVLEGFLEGSLQEVLLRRVLLGRRLVRVSVGTGVSYKGS